MRLPLDQTHDPERRSWVESANDPAGDFPIQNLPFGVFRLEEHEQPRIGVAIGDRILDVRRCAERKVLPGVLSQAIQALAAPTLNDFMALGRPQWSAARLAIGNLLDVRFVNDCKPHVTLIPMKDAQMLLPATIGDYTDFYASIHHATNVGSMFRPDQPLMPNYKHLPVGYHGRASSIVVSGTPVIRPMGQINPDDAVPIFGPTRLLDYELEVGLLVGPGNGLGQRIPVAQAAEHVFGLVLVNDWSARDVQKWEYQPLGPFNAKNFATTTSPWVVTLEALAPFWVPSMARSVDDPPLLDYLKPPEPLGLDLTLEVSLSSEGMRKQGMAPMTVSRGSFADMFWTLDQLLAHHTSTGCNLRPGDLLASGTVSGPTEDSRGCLLERTWRGTRPFALTDGTERRFLQDGDEVTLTGWASLGGRPRIGLGRCTGIIQPAR
jgi:fumarylacetoacetase